jgi:prepilin-type N-terminal cleavage/methylation domain-containing protein
MSKLADFRSGSLSLDSSGRWVTTISGFTFIEVLIALTISAFIFAAVVSFFIGQQKHYNIRMQVAAMQENTRTGLDFMGRELSMAGYDPTETAGASIVVANASTLQVTMDLNGNGTTADADENVTYVLFNKGGAPSLGRTVAGTTELVASNISALRFDYTLADGTVTSAPADPSQIRAIDVTLTGRTAQPDPQYHTNVGYRDLTLTTRILVRNMAL